MSDDKSMLMIPGPTPVPEQALLALAQQPIAHRSSDFNAIMAQVRADLQWLHQTENEVLILAASGTGAMEAGIINFLSLGDRVLVGCNGKFGDRWAEVATVYGLQVERLSAPWGQPLDPERFRETLAADRDQQIKAVIITHSETSTGILNDLETINTHVKAHGKALIIVDAVTSLGTVNVPVDVWGLDVVVSGSQKGYMAPPGLSFVAVSNKAWEAYATARLPRFYLDLGKYYRDAANNSTPFTPPVNLLFALQVTLKMMRAEGLDAIFARHQRLMSATRAAIRALNLKLFAADAAASPAITAVMTDPIDVEAVRSLMQKHFAITLASGQNHLKGKILRIGHLGFVSDRDILTVIAALEATLQKLTSETTFPTGAGLAAAAAALVNV